MKTKKEIIHKIWELTKEKKGTEGSKAYRINGQIDILNWVIE